MVVDEAVKLFLSLVDHYRLFLGPLTWKTTRWDHPQPLPAMRLIRSACGEIIINYYIE